MRETFDGIVLGTGHNALVLQAYLCRCGLEVIALDRAAVAGGGLATIENPRRPGFRHNTHAFFHRAVTAMPWYRDLQLEAHGARYVEPELNVAMLLPDGRSLQWWRETERTLESFARFSQRDADRLASWIDEFRPIVERILIAEAQSPPLPPEERRRLLCRSPEGRRLLEVSALSPVEFVAREFENDVIRAGLLFFNGLREVDLRLPGFGHSIPALMAARPMAQMCLGGSRSLADALIRDIQAHGGTVRTGCTLRRMIVRQGRVCGVELEDGERIEAAGFVASGLNPQQTLLELLSPDELPETVRRRAAAFRYNLVAPLFALNVALREPPRYRAADNDPALHRAFMTILGLESFGQFDALVASHEKGRLPPWIMWGACPTLFDPSQAPPGDHTAFMWQKVPYALYGDPKTWETYRDAHGAELLRRWATYAPNLSREGIVLDAFSRSPLDTESQLPNMRQGDLLVGSFDNGQVGYHRPFPGAGRYRTPVPGLYLCGGSTHPGGNITGLCGYNAARVIAEDLGTSVWWNPPDIAAILSRL